MSIKKSVKLGKRFTIKLTNKWLYSFIALGVVLIFSVLVYANHSIPNPGHAISELETCGSAEILKMNNAGTAWGCSDDDVGPSGGTSGTSIPVCNPGEILKMNSNGNAWECSDDNTGISLWTKGISNISTSNNVLIKGDLEVEGNLICSNYVFIPFGGYLWSDWTANGDVGPTIEDNCPDNNNVDPYTENLPDSKYIDVKKVTKVIVGTDCASQDNVFCETGWYKYNSESRPCDKDFQTFKYTAYCQKYQKRTWSQQDSVKVCIASDYSIAPAGNGLN